MEIYLDNSATTRPRPEVVRAVSAAMEETYGNPSSLHRLGVRAEAVLRSARETIAGTLSVSPGEVTFTSGGTEANNLAIIGAALTLQQGGKHVITTAIEHPSVLRAFGLLEEHGFELTLLKPDGSGLVDAEAIREALRPDTVLVSTMYVNNETGAIQPLENMRGVIAAERARRRRGRPLLWHVDAVQGYGKLPFYAQKLGADLATLSAHKIHGPKGVGALYVRRGVRLKPLLVGGGQESGVRAGTENVPGIAGFAEAARHAFRDLEGVAGQLRELKRLFIAGITARVPDAIINGPVDDNTLLAPHIVNVSFPGIKGEVLVHYLEERGVYVSTGAACSSRRAEPSHVLKAMGLPGDRVASAIRFSFSPFNTIDDVQRVVSLLDVAVAELRVFARR